MSKALEPLKALAVTVRAGSSLPLMSSCVPAKSARDLRTHACLQQGAVMQTADGRRFHCATALAAWIADLQETASLVNVRAHPAEWSDPNYLVPRGELNSITGKFERRTERHHDKASPRHETHAARIELPSTATQ